MPTDIQKYMDLGVELTNKHANLNALFAEWPKDRIVALRVLQPHPEVAGFITDWLQLYADGRLAQGGAVEDPYTIFLDAAGEKYQIRVERGVMEHATTEVFVDENTFWELAGRITTLYTTFMTSKPIYVKSKERMDLRDLAHMDKVMAVIHETLLKRGINFASIAMR